MQEVSRNQSRFGKGIRGNSRKNRFGPKCAMIIGLEYKMDSMKIEIMNIVSKKIYSLKFQ